MQNQTNNPAGQDPKTSTPATSDNNSGESAPQDGENVVNEQEQNKSVNQEEFVQDAAQNTHEANTMNDDGDGLPVGSLEKYDNEAFVEIGEGLNEVQKKAPVAV